MSGNAAKGSIVSILLIGRQSIGKGDNMNKNTSFRLLMCMIAIALLIPILTLAASANSAGPPKLTVIVLAPPNDLKLSIQFANGSIKEAITLEKEQKAWEAYYRFPYGMRELTLEQAVLIVESSEKSFEYPLAKLGDMEYDSLVTLDVKAEQVITGQSPTRKPLLVSLRVILTLLIEGAILYAMGYRSKRSWIVFLLVNLITQTWLNLFLTGPFYNFYWIFGLIYYEFFIFIIEAAVYLANLTEHKRGRAFAYAFLANLASLVLGGLIIAYLPV